MSESNAEYLARLMNEASLASAFIDDAIEQNSQENIKISFKEAIGMKKELLDSNFIGITISDDGIGTETGNISSVKLTGQPEWFKAKVKKADELINQKGLDWMMIHIAQQGDEDSYKRTVELMPRFMIEMITDVTIKKLEDAIE